MRQAARVVAILGAVAVAWLLIGRTPKEVTLVYDLSAAPDAQVLEVEVVRGADVLRRAEFRLAGRGGRVEHTMKLREGEYLLRGRIDTPSGPRPFQRPLEVREAGTIVLPLGG